MTAPSFQEQMASLVETDGPQEKRIYGLKGGAKGYGISLALRAAKRPILIIVPTAKEAESLARDLAFFMGEEQESSPLEPRVHYLPPWDILPFENLSPHPDQLGARLEALYRLTEESSPVIVTTPPALLQRVPPQQAFKASYRYFVVGDDLHRETFVQHIVDWGFHPAPLVEERGDFSVRGGILDLFPPGHSRPVRIEIDEDRIESIREFDPQSQRSQTQLQEFLFLPLSEFSLRPKNIREITRRIDERADALNVDRHAKATVVEALKEGLNRPGMEFLVPYYYDEESLPAVFSYLPENTVVWVDQPSRIDEEVERFAKLVAQRSAKAQEEGRVFPEEGKLYVKDHEWEDALAGFSRMQSEALDILEPTEAAHATFSFRSYVNTDLREEIALHRTAEFSLTPLIKRVGGWPEERLIFVARQRAEAHRLQQLLADYELDIPILEKSYPALLAATDPRRSILIGGLSDGFRLPDERLIVITLDEILGKKKTFSARRKKEHPSHFITTLSELTQDDFVVHLDHGIGIYRGLKFLKIAGTEGEFVHLEYQGGDRLYLPVDRINLVQKFIGADGSPPLLDRLGGTSWEKVKAKTRKSILSMARELLQVYAAREVNEGHSFPAPDHLYREFEGSFEYDETPDQDRAIEETLRDMMQPKPMDRLVCGDVGYGKTEVAMRAAFVAAMGGRQVAVLAPTTILVQQHLETFRQRFSQYPVRVESLSRFSGGKDTQEVLRSLSNGVVDIVIGTHRLLQKDVTFGNLGLIIVDEEHRFGVAHKEKLKKLRHTVDVLSLTATPIPRTLHMSLIGIRDLSVIETPPANRLAIRTYVTRYEDGTIRDAILREINREGQVFFLHNRVESIHRIAQKLMDLVPEARIAVAHGQMQPRELRKTMLEFQDNQAQVLVCSAIIESGLDFPNANTIIINRADRFGLAQLYQLRGRVGRSSRRAYAYLLIPASGLVTRDAEKRLRALQELDELGSGFKLALHDMEIRGAGNLLGREQSGQIAAVGFELYTQMMEETIRELKGEEHRLSIEPEIRIEIPAYFPERYIPNMNQRLLFYKRLANLHEPGELNEIREELEDRYGPCPQVVENLFEVMELRRSLIDALVLQITFHNGKLSLLFHKDSPIKVDRLMELVSKDGHRYRLSPEGRLSYTPSRAGWQETLQEVSELLQLLQ